MATSAPSSASARAAAAPMPREPPVTKATFPVSFFVFIVFELIWGLIRDYGFCEPVARLYRQSKSFKLGDDDFFGYEPHGLMAYFAVHEVNQCRNGLNAEPRGKRRIVSHIDLHNFRAASLLDSD